MLEMPKSNNLNLIDDDEFNKRGAEFLSKHSLTVKKVEKLPISNKISWGTIVERSARKYPDNIAIRFEDTTFTYKEFNEWVNHYAIDKGNL